MVETVRYTVTVQPVRIGWVSKVPKKTLMTWPDKFWIGWTPEPTFWRPTKNWAINRAERKRRCLIASDARENSKVTVK